MENSVENQNAKVIDGRAIAKRTRTEIKTKVQQLSKRGVIPKLAVILVGGHPPSQIYVKYKQKAAQEIGILSEIEHFDSQVSLEELYECVDRLNRDDSVHGILVQLPLPPHLSTAETARTSSCVRR